MGEQTIIRIISFVLIVMLLVGGIGAIAYVATTSQKGYSSFVVEYDGQTIKDSYSGIAVKHDDVLTFGVKYTYPATVKKKAFDYAVKVVPYEGADFTFEAKGVVLHFKDIEDLTEGFDITKAEDGTSFTLSGNTSIWYVLSRLYGDGVTIDEDALETDKDYFKLVVTSYDEKVSIQIGFHPNFTTSIKLSESKVIL